MKIAEPSEATIIRSSRFGEMVVDQEKVITLTSALAGFPETRHFALRQHSNKSPFMWLQSLDNPELAFVVIEAKRLVPLYEPEIPLGALRELGDVADQGLEMLLILAIPKGKPAAMTANLLGPLVINPATRLAKQVLLDPEKYDPCWPVFATEEG
ncbi:flagellar assembly protein FliW [Desulfurivibrio sp. D14AmB]|uniref:flagellar assembly protein FliW n=1 Tax=Desulfurivibrio sp. D14AmB TaxID=3374370 RepID=UPI00376EE18E